MRSRTLAPDASVPAEQPFDLTVVGEETADIDGILDALAGFLLSAVSAGESAGK